MVGSNFVELVGIHLRFSAGLGGGLMDVIESSNSHPRLTELMGINSSMLSMADHVKAHVGQY